MRHDWQSIYNGHIRSLPGTLQQSNASRQSVTLSMMIMPGAVCQPVKWHCHATRISYLAVSHGQHLRGHLEAPSLQEGILLTIGPPPTSDVQFGWQEYLTAKLPAAMHALAHRCGTRLACSALQNIH